MSLARLHKVSVSEVMPQVLAFVEQARKLQGIEKIILFGSLSRHEMTAASDIDLAVLLASSDDIRDLKAKLREIKRNTLQWPCDLFVCDQVWFDSRKEFGGVCVAIQETGKILYDRAIEDIES